MSRFVVPVIMIVTAALSRLVPHPPNVAPITALALFSAVYLDRRLSFVIPLAALLLSDIFLGFYAGMIWVYASFAAIAGIGIWLSSHRGIFQTAGASLAGSLLFFIVTNFGVWISSQVSYPHTFAGLTECYVAAIPFFRNTLVGDMGYVAMMFGLYEVLKKFIPALNPDAEAAE